MVSVNRISSEFYYRAYRGVHENSGNGQSGRHAGLLHGGHRFDIEGLRPVGRLPGRLLCHYMILFQRNPVGTGPQMISDLGERDYRRVSSHPPAFEYVRARVRGGASEVGQFLCNFPPPIFEYCQIANYIWLIFNDLTF
jgi:hypothetical protein